MRGQPLQMTPKRTVLAYEAEDGQGPHLEIYDAPEQPATIMPVNPPGAVAGFTEADNLRVFLHTDTPHILDFGLLEGDRLTLAGRTDAIHEGSLYYCDGKYYSILGRDSSTEVQQSYDSYRIDPDNAVHAELFGAFTTADGMSWGSSYCSRDRLFLHDTKYEQDAPSPGFDAFVQVRNLEGGFAARVALPKRVTPHDHAAIDERYYVLWENPGDDTRFGLTIVDRDGVPTQVLLPLPSGQRWSSAGPIEVAAEELRMSWLAEDGTPYLSIWRLAE